MTKTPMIIILNSLIWGIVIILCSRALKEPGTFNSNQHILGGGAAASLIILDGPLATNKKSDFEKK